MPDSFDSAEGMTHSYGDGCEPPHVPPEAPPQALCQSCGAEVNQEVSRTTRRLLASLDASRRQRLRDAVHSLHESDYLDAERGPRVNQPVGSILSDRSIRDAIATRLMVVEPFIPANVQASSLDLTLGGADVLILSPGVFRLAATAERVTLPATIQGQVHGRSSIGRLGVLVHFTAGLIDPGFSGEITLECMALAQGYTFYPGDRIAQITFHWLDCPAENPYNGRYQDQVGATGSRFKHARDE